MWYESKMINETLDSLQNALHYSSLPVDLKFCLNMQTYLETPIDGDPEDMFKEFLNHPVLKKAEIIYKTNKDPFYNIGDWRREIYLNDYKYTIWGESDCLIPEDYFYILSNIEINEPHILTLSSRVMWDNSWTIVEHVDLQSYPNLDNQNPSYNELFPYRYYDYIDNNEINKFNNQFNIEIIKLDTWKVDGSLLSLSGGLPYPFIAPDMNFIEEDTCAAHFFSKKNIPQYHISTRIKGHNYYHPLKRTNTNSIRDNDIYKKYANLSKQSMIKFLNNI
jgi:hypothetical protein